MIYFEVASSSKSLAWLSSEISIVLFDFARGKKQDGKADVCDHMSRMRSF